MKQSFRNLLQERQGENYSLHKKYINPSFARVLEIIGFNRYFVKGVGPYLYDDKDKPVSGFYLRLRRI